MWTPRRVVMLSVCFVAAFACYLGYAYTAVGDIDGLPPLPEVYWPRPGDVLLAGSKPNDKSILKSYIQFAFGDDCPELQQPIRLVLPVKNMVMTAADFTLAPDGRVCLNTVSLATIKARGNDHPDVTTLRASVAWITFDQPVRTPSEIAYRRIVEAELNGRVEVRNNRGRKERDEDLHLEIPSGPVYYRDETHRIWTNSVVRVYDRRSKPEPHSVVGQGMVMELMTEAPAGKAAARGKPQRESITGVKWVELLSAVTLVVHLDGGSGFLGGDPGKRTAPDAKAAEAKAKEVKAKDRAKLTIKTPGKFRYEIHKDHDVARFDALTAQGALAAGTPAHVHVERLHLIDQKRDQLDCHQLTLRLKRKEAGKDAKKSDGDGIDVETALATSSGPGRYVTLTSDSDGFDVRDANELLYDAAKQLTTVKAAAGAVKVTYKADTHIQSPELEIQDVKPPPPPGWKAGQPLPVASRPYQKVKAKGPGWVEMVEKPLEKGATPAAAKRLVRAEWNDLLTSDRADGQDVLTLTGNAKFIDDKAGQRMSADLLKVWMDAPEQVKAQPADGGPIGSRKPREVHAVGNVVARSKEVNVHDTGKLVVKFVDVLATKHLPPGGLSPEKKIDKRPVAAPVPAEKIEPRRPQALPKGPVASTVSRPGAEGPVLDGPPPETAQKPFELTGRLIEAKVERSPIRSVVEELYCEGQVKVVQEPADRLPPPPVREKGTEITGDKLRMTALTEGGYHPRVLYKMQVLCGDGPSDTVAQLTSGRLYVCGPEINVDQLTNKAWVVGDGAMQMESNTDFQGASLKAPVPMTVHWRERMLFDGTVAEFLGGVEAEQKSSRLQSEQLQVTFNRMVSLKEGNRSDEQARVKKLVCNQDARVADDTRDPRDPSKTIKYQALRAPVMYVDSLESLDEKQKAPVGNRVVASGPGTFRVWEAGTAGELDLKAGPGPAKDKAPAKGQPPKQEYKTTLVSFGGQMHANSEKHTVNFYNNVRVLNLPCPRHDVAIDMDQTLLNLPAGALYLRCSNRLEVLDVPTDGQPNKQMTGTGNVYVQGKEFYAHAQVVKYNQQKQQVILEGSKEAPARLVKQSIVGGKTETVEGLRITYNRAQGETKVEGGTQVQGESPGGRK